MFDNDGTLWCEKPMPVELGFILERFVAMAGADESLRTKEPWRAAYERDYAWLGGAIDKHYAGDDSDVQLLLGGVVQAYAGQTVEEFAAAAATFLDAAAHPTLGRLLRECAYAADDRAHAVPRGERFHLLHRIRGKSRLHARDLRRAVRHRAGARRGQLVRPAVHATTATAGRSRIWQSRTCSTTGPVKPVRIWSRIGRRPVVAGGNSNGDVPMLRFARGTGPALRLLVLHDDPEREFEYVKGAERALERAQAEGWTVVSVKNDWATVFADA